MTLRDGSRSGEAPVAVLQALMETVAEDVRELRVDVRAVLNGQAELSATPAGRETIRRLDAIVQCDKVQDDKIDALETTVASVRAEVRGALRVMRVGLAVMGALGTIATIAAGVVVVGRAAGWWT